MKYVKYVNKRKEGLDQFVYLKTRFNMTDNVALETMEDNNQDTSFYKDYIQGIEEEKNNIDIIKLIAVSECADVSVVEAKELIYNDDWIVLTDEEADDMAKELICGSVWAFAPWFLSAHTSIDEDVFKLLQEKCEDSNDAILSMIKDIDEFWNDAINADGRGHFISHYDGYEHEATVFGVDYFCYRIN